MTQTSLAVRIDPKLKAALEREAKADHRSLSSLVVKILDDWVRENATPKKKVGR